MIPPHVIYEEFLLNAAYTSFIRYSHSASEQDMGSNCSGPSSRHTGPGPELWASQNAVRPVLEVGT